MLKLPVGTGTGTGIKKITLSLESSPQFFRKMAQVVRY